MYHRIICVLLIFFVLIISVVGFAKPQTSNTFAILPLIDKTDFKHKKWNLTNDFAKAFIDTLEKNGAHLVANLATVDSFLKQHSIRSYKYDNEATLKNIAHHLKVDYVIVGTIQQFSLSRVNLGNPMLGGYESYECTMSVEFFVYDDAENIKTESRTCLSVVNQKELGLTLLLKPSDKYLNFERLDEIEFASPEFKNSIFGIALKKLKGEFVHHLSQLLPDYFTKTASQNQDDENYFEAQIVFIRNGDVYVNVGSSDNVHEGDVLPVYAEGEEITDPDSGEILGYSDKYIGKIKILKVKDRHLSLAKTIETIEEIRTKNTVRIKK